MLQRRYTSEIRKSTDNLSYSIVDFGGRSVILTCMGSRSRRKSYSHPLFDYRRTDCIGRATALAFAHDGASVVVSGRHDNEGQKLATELRNLGTEAEFVRTDVRMKRKSKPPSTRSSLVSVASTLLSITLAPSHSRSAADVTPRAIKPSSTRCAWCTTVHEVRDSGHATAKAKAASSTSRFVRQGSAPTAACMSQQACRRGITKSAAIELAGNRRSCQHRWPWSEEMGSSTALRNRRKTKQNSSRHTFLPSAWNARRDCKCHRVHWL